MKKGINISIHNVLPIALCLLLPPLNFITTKDVISKSMVDVELLFRWGLGSVILYVLWHLLDIVISRSRIRVWLIAVVTYILFMVAVYSVFFLSGLVNTDHVKPYFVLRYLWVAIPFLLIQYAFRANKNIARLQLEKEQMHTENYKVQLDALRTKVDPHFLFNSLNTLRTMVRHHHPQSEQFVLSLSDFYRQTLKYNEDSVISLAEEVDVLKSYLFLMQNRNEDAVKADIRVDERALSYQIPTLALQSVVENCFKHNAMTSRNPLYIKIYNTEDGFVVVENNLQPRLDKKEKSGFGLDNLTKRYALLGMANGVTTESTENTFTVKLKLIK